MAVVNRAAERQTVTNYILVNVVIVSNARFHSNPRNHSTSSANKQASVYTVRCVRCVFRSVL